MRTLDEAIKERRQLPQKIIIEGTPYPNSNETPGKNEKMEKQTIEYKYCSWKDNSEAQFNIYSPVIECNFNLQIKLDRELQMILNLMKKIFKIVM